MSATYEDRYGLPLSAQGQEAAAHYMEGIDCALALSVGALYRGVIPGVSRLAPPTLS